MIQWIPEVPTLLRKSQLYNYANAPFIDALTLIEMPRNFTFPNTKPYDGTTYPTDHIALYKQRIFTAIIPRNLWEACMYKSFGSSLMGPALRWFTNLLNNCISSFA